MPLYPPAFHAFTASRRAGTHGPVRSLAVMSSSSVCDGEAVCFFLRGMRSAGLSGRHLLLPRRHPGFRCNSLSRSESRERTCIQELARIPAKTLPHWIHPDVPGDALLCIGAAQNVVIEFGLPQTASHSSLVFIGRRLLEAAHKSEEVRFLGQTLYKKMEMIGHQTVGVNSETRSRCRGPK